MQFFDPRTLGRPLTLAEVQQNLAYSNHLMTSQGMRELPRPYETPAPVGTVLRDKPMSQAKRLALVLLEQEVLEFEDDTRPDYCDGPDVHDAWRTKVRTQMAHRIRELLRRVSVARTKTMTDPDGNTVKVTKRYGMRTALVKLRALRYHPAFQRTQACAEHWTYRTRQCDCPTETQRRLRKSIAVMTKHDRPWVLLLVYLTYQGYVQHYYDFLQPVVGGKDGHENGDRRVWEGDRRDDEKVTRWRTEVDEDGVEHEVAGETEMVTVVDGGKTQGLSFDLQGWDRPSSFPTRTTRMAFCTACMDLGNPWFRVPLKRIDGRYERPAGEVAVCPTCGGPEGTPEPRTEAITYTARQRFVRKGQPVVREEVFERRNGRWFYGSTNERCHVLLSNEIERRWRKRPAPAPRKVTGKVMPQPKTEPVDGSLTFNLTERQAWYQQGMPSETPVRRTTVTPTAASRFLGKLVALRTEDIKPWVSSTK
jgi:hypothetical protein